VIDLSNHRLPKVLGELKITGFSNYLHPYDAKTVIGFGQETNDQGQQTGLKVTLFDVSNVNSPRSLYDYVLPVQYVYSTAQWEHKAFLFSREKNLMVVPASYYNYQNNANGPNSFNGAMVFHVKRDASGASIQLRAIVNHLLTANDKFYTRYVERSLYIENMLYTKSQCLLRVHNLERLQRVLNLGLNCEYNPETPINPPALPVFNPPAPLQISGLIPVV
jgi:inhibitor of cysteine peptidase